MVFGFGAPSLKGCNAIVTVAKNDFYPGEVVQGQLSVSVTTAVECQEFTLGFVGLETLTWEITTSGDENSASSTAYYDVKKDIIRQEISLLQPGQTALPPGQHVYPFAFSLPPNLPATQETIPAWGNGWERIHSHVLYGIEVKILQKGAKKHKFLATQMFNIHALPLSPALYPGRAVEHSKETRVMYFCCFNKGICKVALSLDRDTVDINTGVLPLVVSVTNETSLKVTSFTVSIQQDLLVHIPDGRFQTAFKGRPQVVHAKSVDEVIAPHTTKEGIQLPVSLAEFSLAFRHRVAKLNTGAFNRVGLVPTCDILYASVRFRLEIQVHFTTRFVTTVQADLPVTLLNIPEFTAAPVAVVPLAVAVAPTLAAPLPGAVVVDGPEKLPTTEAPASYVSAPVPVSKDQ